MDHSRVAAGASPRSTDTSRSVPVPSDCERGSRPVCRANDCRRPSAADHSNARVASPAHTHCTPGGQRESLVKATYRRVPAPATATCCPGVRLNVFPAATVEPAGDAELGGAEWLAGMAVQADSSSGVRAADNRAFSMMWASAMGKAGSLVGGRHVRRDPSPTRGQPVGQPGGFGQPVTGDEAHHQFRRAGHRHAMPG